MSYTIVTVAQRPELEAQAIDLACQVWPEFMLHADAGARYWRSLFTAFSEFQFALCDEVEGVVATGNTIPILWDGTAEGLPAGWDAVLERGVHDREQGRRPTVLCALSAVVAPTHRGRGLSSEVVRAMRSIAQKHGLGALIAPVRPNLKSRYPLTPMERYIGWKGADGLPFDPWIRVHWRMGAEILRPAPRSMVITGTVADWEAWTGLCFPESGDYVVPGALQPVRIDRERDQGRYEEPNVWMRHAISGEG